MTSHNDNRGANSPFKHYQRTHNQPQLKKSGNYSQANHERTHDVKFVRRGTNFMSWPASLGGIPMDIKFSTFNAFGQAKWMHHGPMSWIGGLKGELRGLMTWNLFVGAQISRHEPPRWTDSQWISNFPLSMHPSNPNQCIMGQSIGSEFSQVPREYLWREILGSGPRFHVMIPNGLHNATIPAQLEQTGNS